MALRQIAYALARFTDSSGNHVAGQRGETFDIPEAEIERLDAIGALVPEGGELHRPGVLVPLIEGASDEHIANYLISGNTAEIFTQASEYPSSLIENLIIAERAGLNREPLISDLESLVPSVPKKRGRPAKSEAPVIDPALPPVIDSGVVEPPVVEEPVIDPDADETPDELAEFVTSSNMPTVLERAGDNAELAAALSAAESARTDGKKRVSLIEALAKIGQ